MNLKNLTIKSQEALQQAQQLAQEFGHQQLENEHIFKGILEVDENVTPFILKKLNEKWEIDKICNLTDEAEKARDYLMKLPERMTKISERLVVPAEGQLFKWVQPALVK